MDGNSDGYLVICSYAIAILDLISAVLFASVSGVLYAQHNHWTSLAALIFSMLWMVIILMLLLGIYQRSLSYIRYWLVFTCLGIMLDAILLLYGLTLSISINWEGVKITVLPFVGLAVEMTFVYIIYIFYLDMIYREPWIPVSRYAGGCSQRDIKTASSSNDTKQKERKRLKKMYKREEKAALRDLARKLRRGQV
ncbi:uncharacterized protein LOC117787883 [Drosophila innubila]|uniref:uncharacterized protein LOC117787883 n=1 Tax=Drosophila innubila TaxID=198719 RepID=UPI00148C0C65|nr:uncharacterized protein LOC117787883 [Drosophila innubila]